MKDHTIKLNRVFVILFFLLLGDSGTAEFTAQIMDDPALQRNDQNEYESVTFYVQAHQDDWQLFQGEKVWSDINSNLRKNKVVFIYTTAGDNNGIPTDDYWKDGYRGTVASIKATLSDDTLLVDNFIKNNIKIKNINGHKIAFYTYANTESYFLQLPDGGYDSSTPIGSGNGYKDGRGWGKRDKSLKLLHAGIPLETIHCVDPIFKTTYRNWEDFVNTLEQIIVEATPEYLEYSHPRIHVADFDPDYREQVRGLSRIGKNNLGEISDHSDHQETAHAIEEICDNSRNQGKYHRILYLTYCNSSQKANLSPEDIKHKKIQYDAYHTETGGIKYGDDWLTKSYWREVSSTPE